MNNDIIEKKQPISTLISRVGYYYGSPTRIVEASLDYIDDIHSGLKDVVDPSSPFVNLIEMSAVHTASAVNEAMINARRSNRGLAETEEDVYRHMTDAEFVGRFASPGQADFTFMIDLETLISNMVFDPQELCTKAIIPRDTVCKVDNLTFLTEYPIVVKRFDNQVIQVSYLYDHLSPISSPKNSIIKYKVKREAGGKRWLYFSIGLKQVTLDSTVFPIQRESVFKKIIPFQNKYVHCRVLMKARDSTVWEDIRSTHSDQTFNNDTPTVLLKVVGNELTVLLPFIYNTLGKVSGQIRIDVYTSKGELSVNMSSYKLDDFSVSMRNIDSIRDTSAFTNVWSKVTAIVFSSSFLSGGKNGIEFKDLKNKVLSYSFSSPSVPITNAQVDAVFSSSGFDIIKDADVLTNRYFLATRSIPSITVTDALTNSKRLLSKANMAMVTFLASSDELDASDTVIDNSVRKTLLSNTLFVTNNGITTIVSKKDADALRTSSSQTMVTELNSKSYVFTPYYYVFSLADEVTDARVYDLDNPDASNVSFIRQNTTLALPVNTSTHFFEKRDYGYKLSIITNSGAFYKQLNDNEVSVQLGLTSSDGSLYGTINGSFEGREPDTDERIYSFEIRTNYDIDKSNSICITNVLNDDGPISDFYVKLETSPLIIFTTTSITSIYKPDESDTLINKNQLPVGSVANNCESIDVTFGQHLDHMWVRTLSFADGLTYKKYEQDVVARYEKDVYEINPTTNSMLFFDAAGNPEYRKVHDRGDQVFTPNGEPVYSNRKGDVILDENGNPVQDDGLSLRSEFEVFVLDASLTFATDTNYISYKQQVIRTVVNWTVNDILDIQNRLIERTKVFFYPNSSIGVTKVIGNGGTPTFINSEQRVKVAVFINSSVINDVNIQDNITDIIYRFMDTAVDQDKFTISQQESELKSLLGSNVFGVNISGLGGEFDYKSISNIDDKNSLSIKRNLVINPDGILTIKPAVEIVFVKF